MLYKSKNLLTINNDTKTSKGVALGYTTGILYLAPSTLSGVNLCPHASKGCAAACLNTAGRGRFTNVQKGRLNKALWYLSERQTFIQKLCQEIERGVKKHGKRFVVRLNGTSDINILGIVKRYPETQFYDYTPNYTRMVRYCNGELPDNYHLTFSAKEDNHAEYKSILSIGGNVAMVFRGELPETYLGYKVINGDKHDLRFLDEKNVIVGLKAKGKAKQDKTGFVHE